VARSRLANAPVNFTLPAHTMCSKKVDHQFHGGNSVRRVATLPCEILMSGNKWQFETDTVTNDNSQGTAAGRLRYCGIFNDNLLQIDCSVCL